MTTWRSPDLRSIASFSEGGYQLVSELPIHHYQQPPMHYQHNYQTSYYQQHPHSDRHFPQQPYEQEPWRFHPQLYEAQQIYQMSHQNYYQQQQESQISILQQHGLHNQQFPQNLRDPSISSFSYPGSATISKPLGWHPSDFKVISSDSSLISGLSSSGRDLPPITSPFLAMGSRGEEEAGLIVGARSETEFHGGDQHSIHIDAGENEAEAKAATILRIEGKIDSLLESTKLVIQQLTQKNSGRTDPRPASPIPIPQEKAADHGQSSMYISTSDLMAEEEVEVVHVSNYEQVDPHIWQGGFDSKSQHLPYTLVGEESQLSVLEEEEEMTQQTRADDRYHHNLRSKDSIPKRKRRRSKVQCRTVAKNYWRQHIRESLEDEINSEVIQEEEDVEWEQGEEDEEYRCTDYEDEYPPLVPNFSSKHSSRNCEDEISFEVLQEDGVFVEQMSDIQPEQIVVKTSKEDKLNDGEFGATCEVVDEDDVIYEDTYYVDEVECSKHYEEPIINFHCEIFESPSYCTTLRQAEHAAPEVVLDNLSTRGNSMSPAARVMDETGVYKNLLQETAHRAGLNLLVYITVRFGLGYQPIFTCSVELGGMSFNGEPAKTKKQAEKRPSSVQLLIHHWIDGEEVLNTLKPPPEPPPEPPWLQAYAPQQLLPTPNIFQQFLFYFQPYTQQIYPSSLRNNSSNTWAAQNKVGLNQSSCRISASMWWVKWQRQQGLLQQQGTRSIMEQGSHMQQGIRISSVATIQSITSKEATHSKKKKYLFNRRQWETQEEALILKAAATRRITTGKEATQFCSLDLGSRSKTKGDGVDRLILASPLPCRLAMVADATASLIFPRGGGEFGNGFGNGCDIRQREYTPLHNVPMGKLLGQAGCIGPKINKKENEINRSSEH